MVTAGNVANLLLLLLSFLISTSNGTTNGGGKKAAPPKVTKVEMSMEEGFRIYQHWTDQGLTALMSAFLQAKMNDNELPSILPDSFANCYLKSISPPATAKCISRLLKKEFEGNRDGEKRKRLEKYKKGEKRRTPNMWIGQFQLDNGIGGGMKAGKSTMVYDGNERQKWAKMGNEKRPSYSIRLAKLQRENCAKMKRRIIRPQYQGHQQFPTPVLPHYERFRRGTSIGEDGGDEGGFNGGGGEGDIDDDNAFVEGRRRRPNYSLMDSRRTYGLSPVGGLARLLMANVLSKQNKTETRPWQQTVAQIRELKKLKENTLDPLTRTSYPQPRGDVRRSQGKLNKLETLLKLKREREMSKGERPLEQQISDLVRDGIKIGMKLAKKNETTTMRGGGGGGGPNAVNDGDGEPVELFSPRFLSVTERRADEKSALFSPSVFSLHAKGKGIERELSLPKLMKDSKFTGRDQQEWLNLIMEASGANEQIDSMKEYLSMAADARNGGNVEGGKGTTSGRMARDEVERRYDRQFKGLYLSRENVGEICGHFEERKIDTWVELNQKFSDEQRKQMNRTGYSILDRDQLKFIYGPSSPFNDSEALGRLLPILDSGTVTINKLIEEDIHRIAEMRSFDIRQRDIVLSPSLFRPAILNPSRTSQPIILSPVVFSPTILSPTLYGLAILTPRIFSPTILSPRVMTPLILSPFIFSTILLTPIVMQPFILSPGLINSVILSPFVMNPMIMSSQIMHPFILSPLVMTPGLLNPGALSPLVLSPFVMNPQVLSPKAIAGLFLSPYALSPVLWSPVYAYVVLLSPSWLS